MERERERERERDRERYSKLISHINAQLGSHLFSEDEEEYLKDMHTPLRLLRAASQKQEQLVDPVYVQVPNYLVMNTHIILSPLQKKKCTWKFLMGYN